MANYRGIKIYDAEKSYRADISVNTDIDHNRPTSSQLAYYSKYPYHIHEGEGFYYSGSCSIDSSSYDLDCEDEDGTNSVYVDGIIGTTDELRVIMEWLHNDLVKYLEISSDFIIPIGILEQVSASVNSGDSEDDPAEFSVSFTWEQIMDIIDADDE